ncbi:MAG: pyrroline-5-carboxylate reductase [Acidobacteria bacterium]|nr:MAG: pyrroline-5-carboxylate reductase [Acidobacteriota bacterium]
MKLSVLGGGKMGEAFIAGLIAAAAAGELESARSAVAESDIASPARRAGGSVTVGKSDIRVAEVDPDRREYLETQFGIATTPRADEAASGASAILLAVKPGDVPECLETCRDALDPSTLVISIAAGIRLDTLEAHLPDRQKVVRAMPNLGATIRAGVSAYFASSSLSEHDLDVTEGILGAVGPAVRLAEERLLDLVTAVSGSGPAYVFALAEAMQAAATEGGLSEETAYLLVSQTILGAARLLAESGPGSPGGLTAAQWREAVTSKGGTTAAALAVFDEAGFEEIVVRAIESARARSAELGS